MVVVRASEVIINLGEDNYTYINNPEKICNENTTDQSRHIAYGIAFIDTYFDDIPLNDLSINYDKAREYHHAILKMKELGIFDGFYDVNGNRLGKFKPNKKITRAELGAVLIRMKENIFEQNLSEALASEFNFNDIPFDHWVFSNKVIHKIVGESIACGYGGKIVRSKENKYCIASNEFGPNNNISIRDFSAMLGRSVYENIIINTKNNKVDSACEGSYSGDYSNEYFHCFITPNNNADEEVTYNNSNSVANHYIDPIMDVNLCEYRSRDILRKDVALSLYKVIQNWNNNSLPNTCKIN